MRSLSALLALALVSAAQAAPAGHRPTPEEIKAVMGPLAQELGACDKGAIKASEVEATMTIGASGKVTTLKLEPPPAPPVSKCLAAIFKRAKFDSFGGPPLVAKWPVTLGAGATSAAPPAAGPVAHDAGKVSGLSPREIGPRVDRAAILECAKGHAPAGARSIAVTITIAPTGTVSAVSLSPAFDATVTACVKKVTDSLKFPEFKGKPVSARFQYKL